MNQGAQIQSQPKRLEVRSPQASVGGYFAPSEVWLELKGTDRYAVYPRVCFRLSGPGESRLVRPDERCLMEFVRLTRKADFKAAVLSFVEKYGPLGICRHRVINSHHEMCSWLGKEDLSENFFWEPLEDWLLYVKHFGAFLRIARALQNKTAGLSPDWSDLAAVNPTDRRPPVRRRSRSIRPPETEILDSASWTWQPDLDDDDDIESQRMALARNLKYWLQLGRLELHPTWLPGMADPLMLCRWEGPVGHLAIQLAAAVMAPAGLFVCAGCQETFPPEEGKRRPRRGYKAWCPDCGRLAQWRSYQSQKAKAKNADRASNIPLR